MNLHTPPFDFKVEFLLQLFDDALADVAEGSDIVGKNFYAGSHKKRLIRIVRGTSQFLINNTILTTVYGSAQAHAVLMVARYMRSVNGQ
jgi:hypothetical protein